VEKVGGKGGGTRDFARGRLIDGSHAEKAVSLARELAAGFVVSELWIGRSDAQTFLEVKNQYSGCSARK